MKNILSLISISSLLLVLAACGSKQAPTAEEIVAKARAVKTLNAYDEMSCVVYEMKGFPESPQTSIDRFISDDCVEGTGSFELKYSFSGNASGTESVYIQQSGGDYRSDLSNRLEGYRLEITNDDNSTCTGEFCIDNLEQLTSYTPEFKGTPKFSSVFIQLNGVYKETNWDEEFKASREVGIDTWIIQYAEGFNDRTNEKSSFYSPTNLPWVTKQYDIMNRMFDAAERNGMKLIVGLYPGDYSKEDTTKPEQYEFLVERNKQVFDELFALWGNHPSLAGWYITEEFHDGSYPVGWQQEPALSMLANYLQTVAAYVKSKSPKEVCIAPALWRGMPADLCGKWFGKIFAQTPDIDVLYLQDIGGRCLVDFDVDLPNWFAEIKKACDANGVIFGVDIESFKECWCPRITMRTKPWTELEEQLRVAGMFTDHITNFSWATFKPGTDTYEGYKKYLEGK